MVILYHELPDQNLLPSDSVLVTGRSQALCQYQACAAHISVLPQANSGLPKYEWMNNLLDAPLEVELALEEGQFSRWNILNCSQNAGFILEWYDEFDSN